MYNTTGPTCGLCAVGYYGNATSNASSSSMGGCRVCNCNSHADLSQGCDDDDDDDAVVYDDDGVGTKYCNIDDRFIN